MTDKNPPTVGYMNPPKHTRFKKGKSGNPRGRPRKRDDLNTILQRVLNRKITVKGHERKMRIREALILKLLELALQGDKQALALQRRILTEAGHDRPEPGLDETRKKLFRKIGERLEHITGHEEDTDGG